ncbi:alpha-amylase family glycosyl hydrolase [Corynebacterium diphtheriae]|uniref:alpha-amylase family glycosyl hydrolase n=3 Tax=Corynebacterium diphtheriae TaxID=1717 RepID=UPI001EE77FB0|nr:alpha-amylase family glycosyl hydrolase [Corynebacterium diphtheriae]
MFSHVADVMRYWLDQGATGVASRRSLFCQLGILARGAPPSPHLPPPRLHFGEVIHGDYAQIVADTGMDSVTQYELWKAIYSSLKDENFFELDWYIKRHMEWVDSFIPQTFVGNHDVSRIVSVVGHDKAITAACILFTLPGYPQRLGSDDAVRPEFHP